MMSRRRVIFEGKAKILYEGTEPGTVIQHFKDDIASGHEEKKALVAGKGVLNNRISAHLMTRLESIGIPTHFLKSINMREQLVRQADGAAHVLEVDDVRLRLERIDQVVQLALLHEPVRGEHGLDARHVAQLRAHAGLE